MVYPLRAKENTGDGQSPVSLMVMEFGKIVESPQLRNLA